MIKRAGNASAARPRKNEERNAMSAKVSITINGQLHQATVENRMLLVDFIREVACLTGTHVGCSVKAAAASARWCSRARR